MSRLNLNIIANFLGKGWTAIIQVALVPLYIRFLGVEAFGLIAFFTTLQAVFSLLDMGLGITLNREVARMSVRQDSAQEINNLVRTLEIIYWLVATVIAISVALLASTIAHSWIRTEHLSNDTIQQAVLLMGVGVALEFPFALYSGGLVGLQRQVKLNVLIIAMTTLRGLGAVAALYFISPSIQVFLVWQSLVSLLQTLLSAFFLRGCLPQAPQKPRFRTALLNNIWKFAADIAGISVLSAVLTQLDRIILSRMLTLETFGYYNLAVIVASSLYMIITPIFTAIFPAFSRLVAVGEGEQLKNIYHNACQLMSVLIFPVAIVLALFAKDILLIWTSNQLIADRAHLLVSLLVIGTALNSLMNIPYALQLAYGWTKLAFYQNICSVLVVVPAMFWLTNLYGAVGAASVWIAVNAGYVLIGIQIMHIRILKGEKLRWYVRDVGLPIAATFCVVLIGRWLFPNQPSPLVILAWLVPISALALASSAMVAPFTSSYIIKTFFS